MHKLSIVIITKNSEKYISDAIKSSMFADEVIVLDNFSIDDTVKIAKKNGAIIHSSKWLGFGRQKNNAIGLSKNNWVFVLDSDERITLKLQKEINDILKNPLMDGYLVPRLNKFFGKYIKTCGLYPDYSVRLFDKTKGKFNEVSVHESVQINHIGKLKNHMIHIAYENIEEFINKQKKYAELSEKKPNKLKSIISPVWTFVKIYFIRLGILEGYRGVVIATTYARYTFWKYNK